MSSASEFCPCCEGSGKVPSASGWTDVHCLCIALDANDRVILRGRTGTLAYWEQSGEPRERLDEMRSTMVHLVAGCSGPCRGNSSRATRCLL